MDFISGWCLSTRRLDKCTAIVTGANTGVGKETVKDLFIRGARVVMACRNLNSAKEAKSEIVEETLGSKANGTLLIEKLDLSSFSSIRDFSKRILATEKRIQILVNNAGVMFCPEGRTEDGFEIHMGTNHYGHALLTWFLLPRLIESGPSRVIFVSSNLHYFGEIDFDDFNNTKTPYDAFKAYAKSKMANIMFARALAQKLKENNIKNVTTYSLHPGVVNTSIFRNIKGVFWTYVFCIFRTYTLRWVWKSPRCGAQTTIFCAVDENCAAESGLYYSDCAPISPSSLCYKEDDVAKLWEHTIKMFPQDLQDFNPLWS